MLPWKWKYFDKFCAFSCFVILSYNHYLLTNLITSFKWIIPLMAKKGRLYHAWCFKMPILCSHSKNVTLSQLHTPPSLGNPLLFLVSWSSSSLAVQHDGNAVTCLLWNSNKSVHWLAVSECDIRKGIPLQLWPLFILPLDSL